MCARALELDAPTAAHHVGVQLPILGTGCFLSYLFRVLLTPLSKFPSCAFSLPLQFVSGAQPFFSPSSSSVLLLWFWAFDEKQAIKAFILSCILLSLGPCLPGRFTVGIKHCTWQCLPDPAQRIIKFLCLGTCWTQRLFSLAREANLVLKINIKQTGFFFFFTLGTKKPELFPATTVTPLMPATLSY